MGFIWAMIQLYYALFGWRGILLLALLLAAFSGLQAAMFKRAYRLGQRSVSGIQPAEYAKLSKLRGHEDAMLARTGGRDEPL